MIQRWTSAASALLLVVALLAGCQRSAVVKVPIEGLKIPREYAAMIDITNWRGNVQVVASDRYREAEVRARARALDKSAPRASEVLRKTVSVRAVSVEEGGKRILRVTGASASEPPAPVSLDLQILIPRVWGVQVTNSGGEVELVGVAGPITVNNGAPGREGGDIQLRTGIPMTEAVSLATTEGGVLYQVGPGSTGNLDLQTTEGMPQVEAKVGKIDRIKCQNGRWRGSLENGSNQVSLRSDKGEVRILLLENAGTYGREYWDGWPQWPTSPRWISKLAND